MYNVGDQIDEVVKIGNVKLDKSKYYISETEITFNTESGCTLIWRLPFPKDEATLKEINTLKIRYCIYEVIDKNTYVITQVKGSVNNFV
ncbi:hypothetical protein [Enterococcus sp. HMSC076E04]|uniref:hypothetical protein n=1 Tax=Enterococcus sp. HMSC076E04 TaxID=1739465 RepID=UPI0008A5E983|nr:hypothetical protein [Enterococcus sp. HMSC076E04]OFQ02038.1 hypothetical protein HMPREF2961_00195 [Enterococcus sp. HMSC076E04]